MEQRIKTIQIIHAALCGGVLAMFLVLFFAAEAISIDINSMAVNSSFWIVFGVMVAALFLSHYLFFNNLKNADLKKPLEENFGIYQTAFIIRMAILEGAAMFIFIGGGEWKILGILLLVVMVFLFPTKDRIEKDIYGGIRKM